MTSWKVESPYGSSFPLIKITIFTFLFFSPYLCNFRKSINLIIYKLYEIIWIFMVINLFYIIFIKTNMKLYKFTIIRNFIFIFMK